MILNVYKDTRNEVFNENVLNVNISDLEAIERYNYKEIVLTHCFSMLKLQDVNGLIKQCYLGLIKGGKLNIVMADAREICRYHLFADLDISEVNKEMYLHNTEDIISILSDNNFKIERKYFNGTESTIACTKYCD